MERRTDEELIREAEEKAIQEMREKNMCVLQHPYNKNIIIMTTVDGNNINDDELKALSMSAKQKLITNAEKQYFNSGNMEFTDEQIKDMIPAAFTKFENLPNELKSPVKESLEMFGDDSTYVMVRFFQYLQETENYYPVALDIKDGQFVSDLGEDEESEGEV